MKKFLCYDTNDAASGKINVDSRGMLKPNSTVPSGSTPYQQLVTDGDGNARWEDKMVVDSELSDTSTTPVQNKVINSALADIYDNIRAINPVSFLRKSFEWNGATENRDNFSFNGFRYTKLDELSDAETAEAVLSTIDDGALYISYSGATKARKAEVGYSSGDGKVFICGVGVVVAKEAGTYTISNQDVAIPSTGVYVITGGSRDGFVKNFYISEGSIATSSMILMQSSESPDKYFFIKVNDAGTISATEFKIP